MKIVHFGFDDCSGHWSTADTEVGSFTKTTCYKDPPRSLEISILSDKNSCHNSTFH